MKKSLALLLSGIVISITALSAQSESNALSNVAESETGLTLNGWQQDRLYTNEFPLKDVTLLDGPFKHARDLNMHVLEDYNVDRLLAPYRKEAGLSAKADSYQNWIGLDGHIGGHYLTALAINYAATGDSTSKRLMDYMVDELKACQDANTANNSIWGIGYCGGVPGSSTIWTTFKYGVFTSFNTAWVPWYNLHKTYAGLRDAWLYGGNETAKSVFLKFCDWGINISGGLTDVKLETVLNTEHGGMNEVYADAYQMTGETKYLNAAKRFSHKQILNSMIASVDNLDNKHANTQVPKIVGFERIAEVAKDANYQHASEFFWHTVTEKRSLAFGGNSRKEYFPQASASIDYINDVEGPESCNTNNMLKLTEDLFRVNPLAKYADYYEKAMYNHILSTQHPDHGGFVYFTPARPRHYRVYSSPNQAMWCCVGTGMENHGKYGEFIYTHVQDSLYLNLFIASELNWEEKGIKVRQETFFPDEEETRLIIASDSPKDFTLMVRSPQWVSAGELKITINGDTLSQISVPGSYIPVSRTWKNGDAVKIHLPMNNTIVSLSNVPSYIAIMHGPILLGAKTGTEEMSGLVADDSRWGHIANGSLLPLDKAPIIVSDRSSISSKLESIPGKPMHFKAPALFVTAADSALILEPFYKIHDSRYMIYWMSLTKDQYQHVLDSLENTQKTLLNLEKRTIDKVAPGEQQPEVDHQMQTLNSHTGTWQNEFWRDATSGGYISYNLQTKGKSNLSLMVRYWGNESGSRSFNILIDGVKLTTENVAGKWNVSQFVNQEYPIPNSMIEGKDTIRVKFEAINSSNVVGGLFYLRLLQALDQTGLVVIEKDKSDMHFKMYDSLLTISGVKPDSSIQVINLMGQVLNEQKSKPGTCTIDPKGKGVRIIRLTHGQEVENYKLLIN